MITKIDKQRRICKLLQDMLLRKLEEENPNFELISTLNDTLHNAHGLLEFFLVSQAKADCANYES